MKTLAIISEFNPFHNGHKYLLEEARRKSKADIALTIMSGDYVQRGEPAIIDKYKRSDSAMKAGFDMVIEMPAFITLQSAEYFALGSIKILEKLGVDYLCFGIENIDSDEFLNSVDTLIDKADELDKLTKENLDSSSFTKARYDATVKILGNDKFISSNNVLALEYIRAIRKINSKMSPIPIKRISSTNRDIDLKSTKISSSTAIRENILNDYRCHVPDFSYEAIESSKKFYGIPNMEYEFDLFKYLLLINQKPMADILAYEQGLDNYLFKTALKYDKLEEFLKESTTKRYTSSRIKRLILNYLLDNKADFNDYDLDFYKVLAFNKKSQYIFRNSKSKPVLTKKDMDKLPASDQFILSKMLDASNMYSLGQGQELNQDLSKKIRRY